MDRPTGVTVLAVLSFLAGGLLLLVAIGAVLGGAIIASVFASLPASLVGAGMITAAVVGVLFAALYAFNGLGLLRLQNWARVLTMVLIVLGLLSAVLGVFGALTHFRMFLLVRQLVVTGIDVWILMYLNKPHVKQAFGVA